MYRVSTIIRAFVFAALSLPFRSHAEYVSPKQMDQSLLVYADAQKGAGSTSREAKGSKDKPAPRAVHPQLGEEMTFGKGGKIRLVDKLQNFSGQYPRPADADIASPKSVNIHPSGKKFYVNSLEGGKTVVYDLPGLNKLAVINHRFDNSHAPLWAEPSGLFKFRHYSKNLNTFMGKPVESTFSHDGRYLWVPYYRRSFDLNAQDPSALAIIDTSTDTIVRLMEAGVLPKMVALSPDGKVITIAHWGDNTVGLIDVSSDNPSDWKYMANVVVGHQLFHNFSLTKSVDRDSNTGEALRGTAFTPDSRYALIACMGGGGIAVIDIQNKKYVGKITGLMPNLRHLVASGDWLYASINSAGYVQRIPMRKIEEAIADRGEKNVMPLTWESVKVSPGARTIVVSPRGDYIFAACNSGSQICVVDSSMHLLGGIRADSYPVGLDISPDGKWLISTSQGRKHTGGNCVDVFSLEGVEGAPQEMMATVASGGGTDIDADKEVEAVDETVNDTPVSDMARMCLFIVVGVCAVSMLYVAMRRMRKPSRK